MASLNKVGGLLTLLLALATAQSQPVCATFDSSIAYHIVAQHSGKALTVENDSADLEAPIVQMSISESTGDNWKLEDGGGGHYHIVNDNSGLAMNVRWGSTENGGHIIQWTKDDSSNNDNWCFQKVREGVYNIVAENSGLAIDVAGGSSSDGATILQWNFHGGSNQEFALIPVSGCATLTTGVYFHIVARHSQKVLGVAGESLAGEAYIVQATPDFNKTIENWRFEDAGVGHEGYYHVINEASGLAMNVKWGSLNPGLEILQWAAADEHRNDNYCFRPTGVSGAYQIIAEHSQLSLDVAGYSSADGAKVVQWNPNNGLNQQFQLVAANP